MLNFSPEEKKESKSEDRNHERVYISLAEEVAGISIAPVSFVALTIILYYNKTAIKRYEHKKKK